MNKKKPKTFSTLGAGTALYICGKNESWSIPYTKLNSKYIVALNVEATAVKFLEGENFSQDPEHTKMKKEIEKINFIKIKNLFFKRYY